MDTSSLEVVGRLRAELSVPVRLLPMARSVRPLADTRATAAIYAIVKSMEPDILHLHCSKAGMLGRIARLLVPGARPGVVYQPHGFSFLRQGGVPGAVYRAIESLTSPLVDICLATSADEAALATRGSLSWRSAITVVPNAVVPPRSSEDRGRIRASLGIPDGAVMALSVGGLRPEKRVDDQLRAFAEVVRRGVNNLHLVVIGDGPEKGRLESLARSCGLAHRIHFVGYVADPGPYQLAADLGLQTSAFESFGLSIAEMLCAGRSVVAYGAPGVRELVRHGASGLLSPIGDVAGLADSLERLALDPSLCARMGEVAGDESRGRFTIERMVALVDSVYTSLLASLCE